MWTVGTGTLYQIDLPNPRLVPILFWRSTGDAAMTESNDEPTKTHYICQTYVEKAGKHAGQSSLQLDKQFQYTSASQAEERADRECRSEQCVGADAYMVIEDSNSGEVGAPTFLARFGKVPEFDAF